MNVLPSQIAGLIKPKLTSRKNKKLQKLKAPKGRINIQDTIKDDKDDQYDNEFDDLDDKFEHEEHEKFDMVKEKQYLELNKLKAKYAAYLFSINNKEEDERRRLKILQKQMDRVNQRRKQFRTYSDQCTFNRNYCMVTINQAEFLTKEQYKNNFAWFDNTWMQRLGLSPAESTKFNLGFNGFVGRMIKRIKGRNKDKYEKLRKNQLEIYTENNTKKKGHQDWGSSSEEDKDDNEDIGMERLDRKTIVMKLGNQKYANKHSDGVCKDGGNQKRNEIKITKDPEEEQRVKIFWLLT